MTVQKKTLAKGTIVKIDGTAYGRVETVDMAAQEFTVVEAPELNPQDDSGTPLALDPIVLGDEAQSDFKFMHYWDPRHADGTALETKMAARAPVAVAVVTPHTTSATVSFSGLITKLAPAQLTKLGYYKREVTIRRTTAIVNAATA